MTALAERTGRANATLVSEPHRHKTPDRKRGRLEGRNVDREPPTKKFLSAEFFEQCKKDFDSKPENRIAENAILMVGTTFAATNAEEARKVNHVFLNTIKPDHAKATNQEFSGRCWLFAGLNMFRHHITKALDLRNFEFSATHLFFWDKIERSNRFLCDISQHLDTPQDDRYLQNILEEPTTDGGYWNTFVNLVNKYGLMPKSAWPESWHSGDSEEISTIINDKLRATACHLRENHRTLSGEDIKEIQEDTLKQIYNVLVKFLGKPPETFEWSYTNTSFEHQTIGNLTPQKFKDTFLPGIDLKDFITLASYPQKNRPYNQTYEIRSSNNVLEGDSTVFLNLPIHELKKYAESSIISGQPVWFGADVRRGYHPLKSALNEKLIDESLIFGENYPLKKEQRLNYRSTTACHAMCLTGVDHLENGKPQKWQVENSWGYYDDEVPGLDGFLTMDDSWFNENVFEIVVHKNFLSRSITRALKTKPIVIEPWDPMTKTLQVP